MSSKATAILPPQDLPELPIIDTINPPQKTSPASKRIQSDVDVNAWRKSSAHQTITLFLARLCESAIGKSTQVCAMRDTARFREEPNDDCLEGILSLLEELESWTREIEPLKSPQRFGNLAFRTWGQRLEERVTSLHQRLLAPKLHPYITELQTYLLGSFGSWIRLDYGSGHELSFLAWLCFLYRFDVFSSSDSKAVRLHVEEKLALQVIPKYLQVVWGLQDRYGLEPAGSHGVWGLDDYQFIPYAIGAAQLRNQSSYLPSAISSPSHKPDPPKMPINELLQFIPDPSLTKSRTSSSAGVPPFANLYTTSIARIHSLKRGPFSEHSPILYDISLTVPNWVKVHSGMMKMWEAECLGKRPVVQHFPFGNIGFVWEGEESSKVTGDQHLSSNYPTAVPTAAPWKTTGSAMPPTGAPWKSSSADLQSVGFGGKINGTGMPATGAPWARPPFPSSNIGNMASTGSAAAASSPFGIISKPSIPSRSRKE